MGDEGDIQDVKGEWRDFLEKFHADNEHAKQRIRKVNKQIILYKFISSILDRSIFFLRKISYVLFFIMYSHSKNVNF